MQPLIEDHTDDIRIIVDYVLYNLHIDGNYDKASAKLQINRINGMNDPRFVSMFVGVLYLAGDRTRAIKVLDDASSLIPVSKQIHTVYFVGVVGNSTPDLIRLKGTVVKVDVSYAFIKDTNQNTYFISATKYGNIVFEEGLDVYFTPGFSAKGARAVDVSLIE